MAIHLFAKTSNNVGPMSTSKAVCRQTNRTATIAAIALVVDWAPEFQPAEFPTSAMAHRHRPEAGAE